MRYVIICILCIGCFTPEKAKKQLDKANDKYPAIVADKTRGWYPCTQKDTVTVTIVDSADFKQQEQEYKLILTYNNLVFDSLKRKVLSLPDSVKKSCGEYEQIIDQLYAENTRLALKIDNFKPIVKTVTVHLPFEDSAKIKVANSELDGYKKAYDIDHDYRIKKESQEKGMVALYIPKWILIVLAILSLLTIFLIIKNKFK